MELEQKMRIVFFFVFYLILFSRCELFSLETRLLKSNLQTSVFSLLKINKYKNRQIFNSKNERHDNNFKSETAQRNEEEEEEYHLLTIYPFLVISSRLFVYLFIKSHDFCW